MNDTLSEGIFRSNEEKLDFGLGCCIDRISSRGIIVRDAGNRRRLDTGHGLDRLWWGYHFNKMWRKGTKSEAFVSLRISYQEPFFDFPEPPVIHGALYGGSGGIVNLGGKVASGRIDQPKSIRIDLDSLLELGFEPFVIPHLSDAALRIGESL